MSRLEPLEEEPLPRFEVDEPEDVPLEGSPLPCADVSVELVDEPLPVVEDDPLPIVDEEPLLFDGAVAVEPVRLF